MEATFSFFDTADSRIGRADSTRACLIDAGFNRHVRNSYGIELASNATAPATTGEAAEVPPSLRQPATPFGLTSLADPRSSTEKVTISGFILP